MQQAIKSPIIGLLTVKEVKHKYVTIRSIGIRYQTVLKERQKQEAGLKKREQL